MLFGYGGGQQWIDNNKKCRQNAGNFDCHADAAVRHGAHCPMEHIQGSTWSHWMPPSVKCLCLIAPAAAMVIVSEWNIQNTTETQLLASNYGTFRSMRISGPETNPLLSSSMQQASYKCEMSRLELKSSRTFLAIKRCQGTKSKKVIKQSRSSSKKLAHICAISG